MSNEHYSRDELLAFGFAEVGSNVSVSRKSSLYAISGSLGSNIRIDDFCILKGRIRIGSYVHVGSHCSLSGARAEVSIAECVSLSTRVTIFTGTDSYTDACLNGPMVPHEFVRTSSGTVRIGQGVIIGAHTVILPNVEIGDGASIGAMCIVNDSCAAGSIVVSGGGRPRTISTRDADAILAQVRQVQASQA
jgi:acetyltransferase-like isoleucine patch superfamily enzyme